MLARRIATTTTFAAGIPTGQFWQQYNKPIELNTNEMMEQRLDYIHNNPVEAGFVEYPEEWLFSSARDYSGSRGLLDINFLE